jgi:hypothetical protein
MHIFSGDETEVHLTPRRLHENYHLDTMFLGIRRVKLQLDGVSYRADPASPIIYSNRFIGGILIIKSIFLSNNSSFLVGPKDSPTKWKFDESKLKILEINIITEGVSVHQNGGCQLEFKLQVMFYRNKC